MTHALPRGLRFFRFGPGTGMIVGTYLAVLGFPSRSRQHLKSGFLMPAIVFEHHRKLPESRLSFGFRSTAAAAIYL